MRYSTSAPQRLQNFTFFIGRRAARQRRRGESLNAIANSKGCGLQSCKGPREERARIQQGELEMKRMMAWGGLLALFASLPVVAQEETPPADAGAASSEAAPAADSG